MKLLINTSTFKTGGALQVADSFIRQLNKFGDHYFVVVIPNALLYLKGHCLSYPNCKFVLYNKKQDIKGIVWGVDYFLDNIVEKEHIDAVFTIFGPSLWKPKVKHICGFARPQLIYEESPFFKELSLVDYSSYFLRERVKLRNFDITSDILITESNEVSKRLGKLIKGKTIFTVTNNASQIYSDETLWKKDLLLPPFDGLTFLTISANHRHKNLGIIRQVCHYFKENKDENVKVRFVITLTDDQFPIDDDCRNMVVHLGPVKIDQCPYLYQQADVMFLPTLLECFSASYAEAMKTETPIITSDLPFAHDLCGEAALYCNTLDVLSVVESIKRIRDTNVRKFLIEKGKEQYKKFDSPNQRAIKYIKIIEESLSIK